MKTFDTPSKLTKPRDVVAIGVKIIYTEPSLTEYDYCVQPPEGSTLFELPFTEDKIGKQVWRRKEL